MNYDLSIQSLRAAPGEPLHLLEWGTSAVHPYADQASYEELEASLTGRLQKLQDKIFTRADTSLLLIFQSMDTGGKSESIRRLMSSFDPLGCAVTAYPHPVAKPLAHDFLWSAMRNLPERGRIAIFDRSYYEEIIAPFVSRKLLRAEGVAGRQPIRRKVMDSRYRSIRNFENHLSINGTRVLKFFLHISSDEQKKRLANRLIQSNVGRKAPGTANEQQTHWKTYRHAYEEGIAATSTKTAPWYVIPSDDLDCSQLILCQTILEAFSQTKKAHAD